jgi:hypothetical protein
MVLEILEKLEKPTSWLFFEVFPSPLHSGEDETKEEKLFRDLWEDETQRDVVIESLKADCEVRRGRPVGL